MENTILHIDIAKIENEVLDLESQIINLQNQLEFKQTLIEYIKRSALNLPPATVSAKRDIGVSEFILDILKDGSKDTASIITAYANETGKTYNNVRNNISNALSRLKTGEKIDNKLNKGGRKAGSSWFLRQPA